MEIDPAITMTMDITLANMGCSIKNLDIMVNPLRE
jgi:hypothetical protein